MASSCKAKGVGERCAPVHWPQHAGGTECKLARVHLRCIRSHLSAGLGWHKVVAVVVRLQLERLRDPQQRGCVLLLGCSEWQRNSLKGELARLQASLGPYHNNGNSTTPAQNDDISNDASSQPEASTSRPLAPSELPMEITNETPAAARTELYQMRGCLFVTTRILVVDFLNARLRGSQVAGIIVLNAQRVTDTSGEGFAVRLFRTNNPRGFVRAFSDNPVAVTAGFAKVPRIL